MIFVNTTKCPATDFDMLKKNLFSFFSVATTNCCETNSKIISFLGFCTFDKNTVEEYILSIFIGLNNGTERILENVSTTFGC